MKIYSFPPNLESWVQSQLGEFNLTLSHPQKLAQSIKQMADYYIKNPSSQTPWSEAWCRQAQLVYYFPLNFIRNLRVFHELNTLNFFDSSFNWYEIGSGLGPSLEAYFYEQRSNEQRSNEQLSNQQAINKIRSIQLLEVSNHPVKLNQIRLQQQLKESKIDLKPQWISHLPKALPSQSLLILSYSLTEFKVIPDWIWSADSIIIIEPSTRDDARRLMQFRNEAIKKGFHAVAPCTHQESCPLLFHSKKDWCHDRLHFDRPHWLLEIEKYLPFKNQTLTLSYLALKKQTQHENRSCEDSKHKDSLLSLSSPSKARVVGDFLDEKGKTRQLICRGKEREFLSFIKKKQEPVKLFRGDLFTLSDSFEKVGDEIRPKCEGH